MTPPSPVVTSCGTCRHWSDRMARVRDGRVEAVCLRDRAPNCGTYTTRRMRCGGFERGVAVDVLPTPTNEQETAL